MAERSFVKTICVTEREMAGGQNGHPLDMGTIGVDTLPWHLWHERCEFSCFFGMYLQEEHRTPYFFQRIPHALHRGMPSRVSRHIGVLRRASVRIQTLNAAPWIGVFKTYSVVWQPAHILVEDDFEAEKLGT
jgi:hypothetical protein